MHWLIFRSYSSSNVFLGILSGILLDALSGVLLEVSVLLFSLRFWSKRSFSNIIIYYYIVWLLSSIAKIPENNSLSCIQW